MNQDGAIVFANLGTSPPSTVTRAHATPMEHDEAPLCSDYIFHEESSGGEIWNDDQPDDIGYDGGGVEATTAPNTSAPSPRVASASVPAVSQRQPLRLLDPYDPSAASQSREVKRNSRTYRQPRATGTGSKTMTKKDKLLSLYGSVKTTGREMKENDTLLSRPLHCRELLVVKDSFAGILRRRRKGNYSSRYLPAEEHVGHSAKANDDWLCDANRMDEQHVEEYVGDDDDDNYYHTANDDDYFDADSPNMGPDEDLTADQLLSRRVEGALNDAGVSGSDISKSYDTSHSVLNFTNTFENLCRQHIKNFMRGAEDYARETNLSKRVSEWTCRLEPILLEQEQRPEFDIHVYSDRALQIVAEKAVSDSTRNDREECGTPHVHFSDVVRGESSVEVGRIFLACLQLANLGNISFSQSIGSISDFDVGLLNGASNRLKIASYRAPSVLN